MNCTKLFHDMVAKRRQSMLIADNICSTTQYEHVSNATHCTILKKARTMSPFLKEAITIVSACDCWFACWTACQLFSWTILRIFSQTFHSSQDTSCVTRTIEEMGHYCSICCQFITYPLPFL